MLQGGCDVNLFAAFGESVQDHVDEDISSGPTHPVAAMHNDWAWPASVGLVDFAAELQ